MGEPFTFSGIIPWLTGTADHFFIARWVFLRALGIIYLIAFVSLWIQIRGLIGSQGILPAQEYFDAVKAQFGAERFWHFPSVFWFTGAGDAALIGACALGVLAGLALIVGFAPMPICILLWILYLSLTVAGQDFLSFQWDTLLIETGFLAILLAPLSILPGLAHETPVPRIALLLVWFLLFRLMFESGVVKLTSGDSTWRNFTALDYHYFTQPLPTCTAWYVAKLPTWFHQFSMLLMYGAELAAPFLLFGPRPLRITAFTWMVALQLMILLTGNYNFFNLLSIALSFTILDDGVWKAVLPERLLEMLGSSSVASLPMPWLGTIAILTAVIVLVGSLQLWQTVFPRSSLGDSLLAVVRPLRTVNDYGLFRVMTVKRPEIIVEGSDDGATWVPYEFRWKPGDLRHRPAFVEPHQPRLDWQMWFAALGGIRQERWFRNFVARLLQGSSDVTGLLQTNPFPDHPPKFIRALLYEYEFTSAAEKKNAGAWWRRKLIGTYMAPASLAQ